MSVRPTMIPALMPMRGKVALEEAFQVPWMMEEASENIGLFTNQEREAEYVSGIVNIQDRVREARATGVGYSICSLTVPGPQGETDPKKAEALATKANDWIYSQIKDYPNELGAFAAVSMHSPKQAVEETRRAIKDLGFHGVLVNNWQHAVKPNGERTLLLYDTPEYDIFWAALQELDVPFYIHPAPPHAQLYDLLYKDRPFLRGPPQSFTIDVSTHLLGIISNGILDRFPRVQIILGHMGERLPYDFDRTNRWFEKVEKPRGMVAKKSLYEYFKDNIWITTSGQFSTAVLNFCINLVGADRILYSVDFPYETYHDAANWFDNVNINTRDKLKIGRENAKRLLKLHDYRDFNVPYYQ